MVLNMLINIALNMWTAMVGDWLVWRRFTTGQAEQHRNKGCMPREKQKMKKNSELCANVLTLYHQIVMCYPCQVVGVLLLMTINKSVFKRKKRKTGTVRICP